MAEKKDKKPSIWSTYGNVDKVKMENLNKGYIDFLSRCKTERESVSYAIEAAKKICPR